MLRVASIIYHSLFFVLCTRGLLSADVAFSDFAGLEAESYKLRETAQKELIVWAIAQPDLAARRLLEISRVSGNPEVRERCHVVLRVMADADYLNQGEGYIGIRMQDELATVPGADKPQWSIRVAQVVLGSAAERAGVRLNDLIVGMEGFEWPGGESSIPFGQRIKQLKPRTPIALSILRDGVIMRIEVILGKRPVAVDQAFFGGRMMDPVEAERKAKDAYFNRWLEQQKLKAVGH